MEKAPKGKILKEAAILRAAFPDARCTLEFKNRFELLVCTVLSAQTTDKRVNLVSPALFAAFPTPRAMAAAGEGEIEGIIRPLGMYRAKAESLRELSRQLEEGGGKVPGTMEGLTSLRGVGRKTANVVLAEGFSVPGFPVDTHVARVTSRLRWHSQWSKPHPDPREIERELCAVFPPKEWISMSHTLIAFGRKVCRAKSPECASCPLKGLCPFVKRV
ncbi:MAG: endonuclease III [Aeriscardovia sp.]|nr:endonuclease III [Aeriscardovia sp.]